MASKKKLKRVYEVVGRISGSHSTKLSIKFVVASSKDDAEAKSGYDYTKRVCWRKDIKPEEV